MDAGPARRRFAGFSLVELLLTLVVLGLVAWVVLRIVDRGTRIRGESDAPAGPEAVLRTAFRMLGKDVRAAAAGGLPVADAIRPVADQVGEAGPQAYPAGPGGPVAVRPGTDQIGLRGAIRSPLVRLEPRKEAGPGTVAEAIRARPDATPLHAPGAPGLDALRARLSEAVGRGKALFFVRDTEGRWAVARVVSVAARGADGALDLVADFSDADARERNQAAGADAPSRLGDVREGGVFDDLVWFVARGLEGRPPDVAPGDPDSLRYPHPFLAVAAWAGNDRWEIHGAGEEVEDLQAAWGLDGPAGALEWRADAPGSHAPSAAELQDSAGRPRLKALRIALVARSPERLVRSSGAPAPEYAVPMNGPAPGSMPGAAPIGWDRAPQRRVRFDREVREERLDLPVPAGNSR